MVKVSQPSATHVLALNSMGLNCISVKDFRYELTSKVAVAVRLLPVASYLLMFRCHLCTDFFVPSFKQLLFHIAKKKFMQALRISTFPMELIIVQQPSAIFKHLEGIYVRNTDQLLLRRKQMLMVIS